MATPRPINRNIGGVQPDNYTQQGVVDNSLATAITGVGGAALAIDKEVQSNRLDKELEGLRTEYLTSSNPSKAVQDGLAMSEDDAGEVSRFASDLQRGKRAVEQGRNITWDAYRIRGETLLRTAIARRPGLAEHFRRIASNTLGTDVVGASVLFLAEQEQAAEAAKAKGDGRDYGRIRDDLTAIGIHNTGAMTEDQLLAMVQDQNISAQLAEVANTNARKAQGAALLEIEEQGAVRNRGANFTIMQGELAARTLPLQTAAIQLENTLFAPGRPPPTPLEMSAALTEYRTAVSLVRSDMYRLGVTSNMSPEDMKYLMEPIETLWTMLDNQVSGKQVQELTETGLRVLTGTARMAFNADPNTLNLGAIKEQLGETVTAQLLQEDPTLRGAMAESMMHLLSGEATGDPVVGATGAAANVNRLAVALFDQPGQPAMTPEQKVNAASIIARTPGTFLAVPDAQYNYKAYGQYVQNLSTHSTQLAREMPPEQKAQLLAGLTQSTAHYIDNIGRSIVSRPQYAGLRGKIEVGLQDNGEIIRLLPGETVSNEDRNTIRELNTRFRVGSNVLTIFRNLGGQDAATTAKQVRDIRSAGVQRGVNRGRGMEVPLGAAGQTTSINQEGYELYAPVAQAAAEKYGIESGVLVRLITQESKWNPDAKSGTGVRGIAQVTQATALGLGYTADNYTTPSNQIHAAAKYLSQLLKEFKGDYNLAVTAYNVGPGTLREFLRTGQRTGNLARGGDYGGKDGSSQGEHYVSQVMGLDQDLLAYGRGVMGITPPEDNTAAGAP